MDVSILIVNYNTAPLVKACVDSIKEKIKIEKYEVIIVDNASEDSTGEILSKLEDKHVKVIYSDENLGFGKANNLAAEYAKGKYLFLLNPDTLLVNDAVSILISYMEKHTDIGVAGGNLFSPDMNPVPSYCEEFDTIRNEKRTSRISYILTEKLKQKLNLGKRGNRKLYQENFNYSDEEKEVAYIFGADMMLKKSVFDEVFGFDKDFFMYGEEEDMTYRIHEKGLKVAAVPEAHIIHLEGAASKVNSGFNARQFRMRMNGTMLYYYKRGGEAYVSDFYRYRSRRYKNLLRIAKWKKKDINNTFVYQQMRVLDDEYKQFMEKYVNG